jgi:hypothetical protein
MAFSLKTGADGLTATNFCKKFDKKQVAPSCKQPESLFKKSKNLL